MCGCVIRLAGWLVGWLVGNVAGCLVVKCCGSQRVWRYGSPEFRADIKKLMIQTGVEGKPTMVLFADTQIKEEAFLEDVNNVLNSGEVPNLFTKDEKNAIAEAMRAAAKKLGIPASAVAMADDG